MTAAIDMNQVQATAKVATQEANTALEYLKANVRIRYPGQPPDERKKMRDWAAQFIQSVNAKKKELETARTSITKPINQGLRAVNAVFKPPVNAYDEVERYVKNEVALSLKEERDEQTKALAEATTPQEVARSSQALVAPMPQGLGARQVWKWRVIDPSKIPAEYYVLDEARINREVRGLQDKTQIPGIEVYQEQTVVLK